MIPRVWWTGFVALTQTVRGEYISTKDQVYSNGPLDVLPQHRFYSSNESSPVLQINVWNESAISDKGSHIFLRQNHYEEGRSSPVILDAKDLSTVYVDHANGFEDVYNTRVQENYGKKYLTFWTGQKDDGFGTSSGFGLAYDETYRLAYNVSTHNVGRNSDLHEFAFTGAGTVLMLAVEDVRLDTAQYPEWKGSKLKLMARDNVIQEIDLGTNELLFSWRALDHISPADTFEPSGPYWDIFHTNSIEKTEEGNYLVSMRHTHSIYLINGKTGDIMWTLGGRQNVFAELAPAATGPDPIAPALSMSWQHHARVVPGTNGRELTLFDNHGADYSHGKCRSSATCSRGLRIAIDARSSPPTVQVLRQYLHPSDLRAKNQGSLQLLAESDNVLVGWGHSPAFTEHAASGETVMDVQFAPWPVDDTPSPDNYRVYKMDWSAIPWWNPAIAVRENLQGDLDVFASWNGATEVREWVVRGNDGAVLSRAKRTGFETRLPIGSRAWIQQVWVEALNGNGTILRASEILDLGREDVTILKESEELESMYLPAGMKASASSHSWIFYGAGIVGVALGLVYAVVSRRRRDYDYVDSDLTDVDSDVDVEDVYLEMDGLKNSLIPRGWERSGSRSPHRGLPLWPRG
ncbi:unnamed protein product [Discula destructiva]